MDLELIPGSLVAAPRLIGSVMLSQQIRYLLLPGSLDGCKVDMDMRCAFAADTVSLRMIIDLVFQITLPNINRNPTLFLTPGVDIIARIVFKGRG
ncbi:MAG: hypothetical protein JSW54_09585 [Fidelibacterota bacterium]|nr:MAG: hypothetical protein JSW54_09585 [Candidatus Neomarinimicrobiota bacterium]